MKALYYLMFWSNRQVSISSRNYFTHKYSYWLCNHCSCVFNKYWYIFTGFVCCCSVENLNNVVENAIVSCQDNLRCKATCYRGYIFRTGREVQSFSCKDRKWTPLLSSCKRKFLFYHSVSFLISIFYFRCSFLYYICRTTF